jgi:hypothetical protein
VDEKSNLQHERPGQTEDDRKGRGQRKPYEKPCFEPHEISIAILGNSTPNLADGLSGSFRR